MSDRPGLFLALDVDSATSDSAAESQRHHPAGANLAPGALRDLVVTAERAGFALVTFADSPLPPAYGRQGVGHRIEAGTLAAYVTTSTDRIGLAPTLQVTTTEPFHLATQLASLDHASNGRAAWLVGAANSAEDLATVGAQALSAEALRRELLDVIGVARDLWDSWQDDAVICDLETGRYLDPARVHHVDFVGAGFSVKGPLITPRPPQGHVVVLAEDHLGLAEEVDVVLVGGSHVNAVSERAADARRAGAPLVFAELELTFAEHDARPPADRLRHLGPAAELLESLSALSGLVDGVRLHPGDLELDLPIIVEAVQPALARAGLLRTGAPGASLRETLGLPRPANRFAVHRSTATTQV